MRQRAALLWQSFRIPMDLTDSIKEWIVQGPQTHTKGGLPKECQVPPGISAEEAEWLARLVRSGVAHPGEGHVPRRLLEHGPRVGPLAASVLEALIEERQEGR